MVPCPACEQLVDWVTVEQARQILGVSRQRVMQFVDAGRLPGAEKRVPSGGLQPFWTIPIASVIALKEARDDH